MRYPSARGMRANIQPTQALAKLPWEKLKNFRRILPVLGSKYGLHFAALLLLLAMYEQVYTIYDFVPSLFQGVAYPNFSRETPGSDVSLWRNIVSLTWDPLYVQLPIAVQSSQSLRVFRPSKEGSNGKK